MCRGGVDSSFTIWQGISESWPVRGVHYFFTVMIFLIPQSLYKFVRLPSILMLEPIIPDITALSVTQLFNSKRSYYFRRCIKSKDGQILISSTQNF